MPKYRVLERSLIGDQIYEEGAEVEYDGYPSGNLEPLDAEGEAKAAELVELNKQRVRDMQAANPANANIDSEALGKAIALAVTQALKEQREHDAEVAAVIESSAKTK